MFPASVGVARVRGRGRHALSRRRLGGGKLAPNMSALATVFVLLSQLFD